MSAKNRRRFVPGRWRERLGAPLRHLFAAPYLPLAAVAVTLASVGYAASLPLQERLMRLPAAPSTPRTPV